MLRFCTPSSVVHAIYFTTAPAKYRMATEPRRDGIITHNTPYLIYNNKIRTTCVYAADKSSAESGAPTQESFYRETSHVYDTFGRVEISADCRRYHIVHTHTSTFTNTHKHTACTRVHLAYSYEPRTYRLLYRQ